MYTCTDLRIGTQEGGGTDEAIIYLRLLVLL
jgi:hypothetical protein